MIDVDLLEGGISDADLFSSLGVKATSGPKRGTHCRSGHPFSPENTLVLKGGKRVCKICKRARQKRHRDTGAKARYRKECRKKASEQLAFQRALDVGGTLIPTQSERGDMVALYADQLKSISARPSSTKKAESPESPAMVVDALEARSGLACAIAAINYALTAEEGMTWLSLWREGRFDACRDEWPDAPDACYPEPEAVNSNTNSNLEVGDRVGSAQ
ncbi:hypothetical protein DIE14_01275 [Burkholderia sp. Bp9017]|uniref:hypothetical protein n=1 Tax=unclassified Burkholderia TaxID=2613784 RepID=UPI000F5F4437|nr:MULTISPECIES: hypothetical protein [unclassified Burkholderia]RQZ31575.1 hypothetical protein DIE14_01275 [Burkholderia sp. Bp9017]RQZ37707.1 hypothetical protein DIE13_01265 [Burkholderia sp. Bp9016]